MRMIIPNASEYVCKWVAHGLGEEGAFQRQAYGIGIVFRDELIAGVVYHDWTDSNCFISINSVSPHWASKGTLRAIFGYPFNQMAVNRVSVIVKGGKATAKWRKMLLDRFGFVYEGKLKDWFGPGQSGIIMRMTRDECRWIEDEQGIERQRGAAV